MNILEHDLQPIRYYGLEARKDHKLIEQGIVIGQSTGFKTIDDSFRLIDGELTVIGGRPGMGKTALAMQMVENVADDYTARGDYAAVFSLEMTGKALYTRMACKAAMVNMKDYRNAKLSPDENGRVWSMMDRIDALPIFIDDDAGLTVATMHERVKRLSETHNVRLMVFDFMELAGDRDEVETIRLGKITMALAHLAKDVGIPVIALTQLNRKVEDRANKMPTMADIRGSGMIEQRADNILLIMRPEYYIKRGDKPANVPVEDEEGVAYLNIAKVKNGEAGMRKLAWIGSQMRFDDLERRPVPLVDGY